MKFILCVLVALLASCQNNSDQKIVAQIGNRVLTQEDLQKLIPQEYSELMSRDQYLDIVRRWMDEEVLYSIGQEQKIHTSDEFQEQLQNIEKKLVVDKVLAAMLLNIPEPNEDDIKTFFKEKSELFKRSEAVYKTRFINSPSITQGWKTRQLITDRKRNFDSKTPYLDVEKIVKRNKEFEVRLNDYKPLSAYPSCLQKTISSMRVSTTSVPNKCNDKVTIIHLEARELAGAVKFFKEVEPDIVQVIKKEQLKTTLNKTIERTKGRLLINVNLDNIPKKNK